MTLIKPDYEIGSTVYLWYEGRIVSGIILRHINDILMELSIKGYIYDSRIRESKHNVITEEELDSIQETIKNIEKIETDEEFTPTRKMLLDMANITKCHLNECYGKYLKFKKE